MVPTRKAGFDTKYEIFSDFRLSYCIFNRYIVSYPCATTVCLHMGKILFCYVPFICREGKTSITASFNNQLSNTQIQNNLVFSYFVSQDLSIIKTFLLMQNALAYVGTYLQILFLLNQRYLYRLSYQPMYEFLLQSALMHFVYICTR